MRISVNGSLRETGAVTLAGLLEELGHDRVGVATALNGDFVPRPARLETSLAEGDLVEIVAPMQGG